MNEERLNMMKKDAILINAARGPVIDEVALVKHLNANPEFRYRHDRYAPMCHVSLGRESSMCHTSAGSH